MNSVEKYEFDWVGYLIIKDMLTPAEVETLSEGVAEVQTHAEEHVHLSPRTPYLGVSAHHDTELNYLSYGELGQGKTVVLYHFWNAHPAFDLLLDHPRTMEYIREVIVGPSRIDNSELRLRYPGNATGAHMGGPPVPEGYRYAFADGRIDSEMVRMVYFLHDVGPDDGPLSVVPASHKSNYDPPYRCSTDDEPGMLGLSVKKGDAVLFTEHTRHGGLTIRSQKTRKTLHVGYVPPHWTPEKHDIRDEGIYEMLCVTDATRARLTQAQSDLLSLYGKLPVSTVSS